MTKRIISSIIIVFMLITCSVQAFALEGFGELRALGIMPDEIYARDASELVTRSELAYITARIMDDTAKAPVNTRFCDVDSTNEFSGYIEFLAGTGIINGTGGCEFRPDDYVTTDVADKMLLSAVGYGTLCEQIGGYPDGYRTIAGALNLNKSVAPAASGYLTVGATARMVSNLLGARLPGVGIQTGDTSSALSIDGTSILGDMLGISVYTGMITEIDKEAGIVTFAAEEDYYSTNPEPVYNGAKLSLTVGENIDAKYYEMVPAIAYVNSAAELVYIEADGNVEVSYKIIDSINGDRSTTAKYSVSNMTRMTFLNDEEIYDVASGAQLRYNNELTGISVALAGNTARIVTLDDEIIYIESWNLTEGGIITDKTSEEITYTRGDKTGLLLSELHLYDDVVVIIDGEPGTYGLIRKDSVFDYCLGDDFAVFVVSDRRVVDTFGGVTSQGVELGQISYDTKDVYYSHDGIRYTRNSGYSAILNLVAEAYMGPDGYVRYIKPSANQELTESRFYGIVCGVEQATFNTETQIQLWKISDKVTKEIYEIKKNTVMNDGITLSELIANSSDFNGSGMYVFETNPNATVRSISRPLRVRGFESVTSTSSEPLRFLGTDSRIIYHDTVDFVGLYTDAYGDFTADYVSASVINKRSKTVDFYSENGDLEVSLALINGDLAALTASGDASKGILIHKKTVLSDDDKVMTELTLLKAGGTEKYRVSTGTAEQLELYSIISYGSASKFSEDGILISESTPPVPLSGDCEDWETSSTTLGYHFAYVEDVSGDRIALSDGTVYSIGSSLGYCAEYDRTDDREPFRNFDTKYLAEGDYVYYYTSKLSSVYVAINGLIVVR